MGDRYRNHHTLLQYRVAESGANPLFKIPVINGPKPSTQWNNVSFSQFSVDVHAVAYSLTTRLAEMGVSLGSTVAVWFSGMEYAHFVYVIAVSRASYVPQLFSSSLTSSGIIFELMGKGGAKAIIYDPSFESLMGDCPYAKLQTVPITEDLPSDEAICFIYHTSGSTSGSPKLVPITHKFVRSSYQKFDDTWCRGGPFDTQDVFVQLGSICHAATMYEYLGVIHTGSCIIQPSSLRFSTNELIYMVKTAGLNRLSLFSALLLVLLNAARKDAEILKALHGMRIVVYGGLALPPEVEDWAHENHIPLTNVYASTECCKLMASTLGKHPSLLKPLPSLSCRFDPVGETSQIDTPQSTQLYEFVVLSDSPDLPQPQLLSSDGNFRTGDLFEKTEDGYYIFRGRDDDWIKSDLTKRCDTKAIEDEVRASCGDLVKDCVVVGNGRPSPALFIERLNSTSDVSDEILKDSILNRMKQFNERRYDHERITEQRLIFTVPGGVLPRTAKGSIRRKAIEQSYLKELDSVYNSL